MPKFSFNDQQITSKYHARYLGNQVQGHKVRVLGKNTSVNEANAFVKAQMPKVFDDTDDTRYSITYLLSDGRYYSSKWFGEEDVFLAPDLSQYGLDDNDFDVESIVIKSVKTTPTDDYFKTGRSCV